MGSESVEEAIKQYLKSLHSRGIQARRGILYGSFAKGTANEWSDIDLIVLAPEFDGEYEHDQVRELWRATAQGDSRIEPIPCGVNEWETSGDRAIIEIARLEGVEITI